MIQKLSACLVAAWMLTAPTYGTTTEYHARFKVTAQFLLFATKRVVDVRATVSGLQATLDITFDKPVKAKMGVKELLMLIRVRNHGGSELQVVECRLQDGASAVTVSLDFPTAGNWTVVLEESDLRAGPASFHIEPGGRAEIPIEVAWS